MPDSLKARTLRGLVWGFVESAGLQGVQLVVGIVLARLLFPEQFGVIGMLTFFMAVAQSFLDSGFGSALIQKDRATPGDICSIFYFNIAVGAATAALLCLGAPYIAAFYGQPILGPLTRVLSLTIVINSFGLIQNTLLTKQIDFKTRTKVSLAAGGASGATGICLAIGGYGVWSLAGYQLGNALFRTILLWVFSTWRPSLLFSFASLRTMFGFGSRLLVSGLLNQIFDNIYSLVIGKLFSPADLGFFTRARTMQEVPARTLGGVVGQVTFPVFSSIRSDKARLKRAARKAADTMAFLNFPLMVGLAVVARPLVLLVLTERWAPSISYIQLLCFSWLLFPLQVINLNLLQSLGRSDLFLRVEVIKKVLVAVNIAVMWRWGIEGIICGIILLSVISYCLNSHYSGSLIAYPTLEQARDLLPYLAAAALMGAGVYAVGLLSYPGYGSMLMTQTLAGVFLYACLSFAFRLPASRALWEAGRRRVIWLMAGMSG